MMDVSHLPKKPIPALVRTVNGTTMVDFRVEADTKCAELCDRVMVRYLSDNVVEITGARIGWFHISSIFRTYQSKEFVEGLLEEYVEEFWPIWWHRPINKMFKPYSYKIPKEGWVQQKRKAIHIVTSNFKINYR